jgi:RHS repeat-associated protein
LDQKAYALHDEFHLTALIDASAVVQERYGYDCFGNPRVMTAAFGPGSVNAYTTDFAFGGYRWDKESGLYQVRHRFYHARLGRWLSRDPIGYRAGTNLYGGMGNNPINTTDPWGLAPAPADIAAFIETYAKEHGGEQPWVGWWDTHQNRAFLGWYPGDDAARYGLVFNPNWATLNAPAPPEGTKPWVEPELVRDWTDYVPDLNDIANWGAGLGDALSFNITKHARDWSLLRHFYDVDTDSTAYFVGELTSLFVPVGTGYVNAAYRTGRWGLRALARYELAQKWLPQLSRRPGRVSRWIQKPIEERAEIIWRAAKAKPIPPIAAYFPKLKEIFSPFSRTARSTLPTPLAPLGGYSALIALRWVLPPITDWQYLWDMQP